MPHGRSGQSLWLGPQDGDAEVRLDIDVGAGRAALTWLPDGPTGVELPPGKAITDIWSLDQPLVTVPGAVAHVSTAMARSAIIEYLFHGNAADLRVVDCNA